MLEVLRKLKGNKAGGKNGILPEMVKSCGAEWMGYILDLFCTVWEEELRSAKMPYWCCDV